MPGHLYILNKPAIYIATAMMIIVVPDGVLAQTSSQTTKKIQPLKADIYPPLRRAVLPDQTVLSKVSPVMLKGGVSKEVPRTPEDVAKYLTRMKSIINRYDEVAAGTLLGSWGINTDSKSMEKASEQTLELIGQIQACVPPNELKNAHGQLANTMSEVGSFLTAGGAFGFDSLTKAMTITQDVHNVLERYHRGVLNCITYYGLNPALDPFSAENPDIKARMSEGASILQNKKISEYQEGLQNRQNFSGNLSGSSGELGGLLNNLMGGTKPADSGNDPLNQLLGPEFKQNLEKMMQDLNASP